ncbi:hypothetical protein BT96DRAFT_922633 [Gymnopus androsaceus JB14]|uniref:Uncharacterized protein n=1 Tax=Gymnopus androsaceus JB14 TaxID=1447944 RepID=A0A6A4HFA7_9AGAR|nr:hypothetical protein BT96DRAFT_922633 [Gymnopus androsaceus JB14]
MTPEETQEIFAIGNANYQNIANSIWLCILQGIYSLAFAIGLCIYLDKQHKAQVLAKKITIWMHVITAVMVTLFFSSYLLQNFIILKDELIVSLPSGLMSQVAVSYSGLDLAGERIQNWTSSIINLIGDGTIAWRAWALWTTYDTSLVDK